MLELRLGSTGEMPELFSDFRKKSGCYEEPPPDSTLLGIHLDGVLIGYFICKGYVDGTFEINQGYLKPSSRHKRLSYLSMALLQAQVKKLGYTHMALKASRSLRGYTKFMDDLGYKPSSIVFRKEI